MARKAKARINGRRRKVIGVEEQTGENLREVFVATAARAMDSLHLTQAEVAERAGMSGPGLSLILSSQRMPGLDSLARIARALRMTVAEMLMGGP